MIVSYVRSFCDILPEIAVIECNGLLFAYVYVVKWQVNSTVHHHRHTNKLLDINKVLYIINLAVSILPPGWQQQKAL